ncbi:MAG: EAL domain-containing response regulator [Paracoccaceae bacterium]|nr:MAG: EAL domain-containing response regulator [Paracoccaceae bacterium]
MDARHVMKILVDPTKATAMVDHDAHVLILDDDCAVAELVVSALLRIGARSHCFTEAKSFLAAVPNLRPTHMIVDLSLPGMDGLEVLRELARRGCRARIIVTSGHGGKILESMRHSAVELGLDVVGVLEKPFRLARLRDLMSVPPGRVAASRDATQADPALDARAFARALRTGDVKLYLQPKVICATGEKAGYEALARWHHPVHRVLPPGMFLSQVEASGQEFDLARCMLDLAFGHLVASGAPGLHIAVNVSLSVIRRPEFLPMLRELREHHGIDPGQVILELTENGTSEILAGDIETLTRIRLDGHKLAIDDFGIGQSSIQRLVQLPFTEIKIDRLFVRDLTRSGEARKVVAAVTALGKALGMSITAEGVENAETLTIVRDLGCDMAQGYFLGRPYEAPPSAARRA